MSLTQAPGPLAGRPGNTNYAIDGPQHKLLATPVPRRVRGELDGQVVVDTDNAFLLHETGLKPQLYVPLADVAGDALTRTDLSTHCPFKGDASYRTVTVGDRVAENALWVYDEPLAPASWLEGYAGVYLERFDRWLDEDDVVTAFPDPYHRVDVRSTSATVEVRARGEVVATTSRALVLSETALPNRYYLPREDVRAELRGPTDTSTFCPYKGTATYWTLVLADGGELPDAVWSYEEPFPECTPVGGYVSFWGDDVEVLATR
ncbi:hypothetical protein DSM104299_03400 [Baekduia alba]|uniref:DUF427 domain-containing protein n=1 Tax=Baekduia alba TaxID=2997333 RepID=UPI00234010C5|nr:DUF427 domain-containing protein [Baekduia alba]WCB94662.1 hypothetical protein DSM104299_03400 [Baekduia alba]